jgi:cytochrome c peroxidase
MPTLRAHLIVAVILGSGLACSVDSDDSSELGRVQQQLGFGNLCGHERCDSVARGAKVFFDHKLHGLDGNGRACSDCHRLDDNFQLSPASAEAQFQADPHDPLFQAIDADDFRTNGENASDFSNVRQNGLIRVTLPLPPQLKLWNPVTQQVLPDTSVDLWRAVPSVLNVVDSGPDGLEPPTARGPNPRGGYQYDARFGTLQEQALGALVNHAQVQNTPPVRLLDDVAAFQNVLVTASRTNLDATEQQGKVIFDRSCAVCHSGPGLSTPQVEPGIPRYTDTFTGCVRPIDGAPGGPRWQFKQCPPRLAKNVRFYRIQLASGGVMIRPSSDPGRAMLTGFVVDPPFPPVDDWQKRDSAPLRNIRNTAPYFSNNSADTLEEVVDHYQAFYRFVNASNPAAPLMQTPGGASRLILDIEKAPLIAYLKTL